MELQTYLPAALAIVLSVGFVLVMMGLAIFIGPKRNTPVKLLPFEGGLEPIHSPRKPFSPKFYQVAILFLVFDIEVAFMYPWAVNFRELSTAPDGGTSFFGLVAMLIFIFVLIISLAYEWKKKAVGWH